MAKKRKRRTRRLPAILEPGRPSKYRPHFARYAAELCANGATDVEVAHYLGIDDSTLYRWRWAYPQFREALKLGKDAADDRVEMSLYRRATGYVFDAVHFSAHEGSVTMTPYREHVPPDPGCLKLWLTNRRRSEWRDKIDVEASGTIIVQERDPTQRPDGYQRKRAMTVT